HLPQRVPELPHGLRLAAGLDIVPDRAGANRRPVPCLALLGLLRGRAVNAIAAIRARPRRPIPWSRVVVHLVLIVMVIGSILPLLYMLSTSIKPDSSEFEFPIRWIPDHIAWENYSRAFTAVKTLTFLRNTLI